jgi:hypothetical protein
MRNRRAVPALALVLAIKAPMLLAVGDRRAAVHPLLASDVVARLEAQGFHGIHAVEQVDGRYAVEARAPDGRAVALEIDQASGAGLEVDHDR